VWFLVVGAGGLGGPLCYAAAAAGAGLVVVDPDVVELSNLQRQIQFTTADLGRPKVDALGDELLRRGHLRDRYRGIRGRFDAGSAASLLAELGPGPRVLVEGSDDLPTKFAASDAAVAHRVLAVIGGVLRDRGQVLGFAPGEACYRCLFEAPPDQAPTCADAGVLGAAVAVIAGAMARAALALAAGRPGGGLAVWDAISRQTGPRQVRYNRRHDCPACRAGGEGS
jgi:molybdopterin-synthase adenylyltransferase